MTVLIVDADRDVLADAAFHLASAGHRVTTARTGAQAIVTARQQTMTLIVVGPVSDTTLVELVARLRRSPGARTATVLAALPDVNDAMKRVAALTAGADDCVPRHGNPREIILRLEALRRRLSSHAENAEVLRVGQLEINLATLVVTVADRTIPLTRGEFAVLRALAEQPGRMGTHEQLAERIYGDRERALGRTITVQVSRLRAKLGNAAPMLETVRGIGYRLRARAM